MTDSNDVIGVVGRGMGMLECPVWSCDRDDSDGVPLFSLPCLQQQIVTLSPPP